MSQNQEIRKLPKRTKIYFAIIAIVGLVYFIISSYLRDAKIEEFLHKLGYANATNVTVFSKKKAQDKDTMRNGTLYSVKFYENGKECRGFILYNYDHKLSKDIECK